MEEDIKLYIVNDKNKEKLRSQILKKYKDEKVYISFNLKERSDKHSDKTIYMISPDEIPNIINLITSINKQTDKKLPGSINEFNKRYIGSKKLKTFAVGYLLPTTILVVKITALAFFIKYALLVINTQQKIKQTTKEAPGFFQTPMRHILNIQRFIIPDEMIEKYKTFDNFTKNTFYLKLTLASIFILALLSFIKPQSNNQFKEVNMSLLIKDTKKYIKVIDSEPVYKYIYKKTYYKPYQTTKFIKLTYSKLNMNYLNIQIVNPASYSEKLSTGEYLHSGIQIGNKISKKGEYPEKFEEILKISKGKTDNTVVYTSYSSANFVKFLKEKNVDIKINTITPNTKYVHFLEPFKDNSDKIKLIKEFKDKRLVDLTIYQWYCSAGNLSNRIYKAILAFTNKFKYKPEILDDFTPDFAQNITPDEVIIQNEKLIKKFIKNLQ